MTTRLHIGSKELRGELGAYSKRFDLLEVRGVDAASLKQAPSAATLRRWRRAVPPSFAFSVVAGPSVGKAKPGDAFDAELAAMLETAKILEARVLVLATSSDVTPAKLWRDRVAKLLEQLPRDGAVNVVWEPSGLWELEDAARQAKAWGVTLGVDPSRDPMPAGSVAYGRLRSLGGTRAYSAAALQKVADNIGERRDAYIVLETSGALKEGKLLRAIVRGAGGKRAGFGAIVRPRGATLRARDDEQEEE